MPGKPISPVLQPGSLTNGLLLGMPFHESGGLKVRDLSSQCDVGTLSGGTSWIDGPFGRCLSFNGSSGSVQAASTIPITGLTAFTLSAWVLNTAGTGTGFPISWRNSSGTAGVFFLFEPTRAYEVGFSNGASLTRFQSTSGPSPDTNWHHWLATHAAGSTTINFYLDGRPLSGSMTETAASNPADSGVPFTLGKDGNAATPNWGNCKVDFPFLWGRVLSLAEIARVYSDTPKMYSRPSRIIPATQYGGSASGVATAHAGSASSAHSDGHVSVVNTQAILLSLSIAGSSAVSSPGGVAYSIQQAIQGTADFTRLLGIGYVATLTVDGLAATDLVGDYFKNFSLFVDGVSAAAADSQYVGSAPVTVAGTAAFTYAETLDSVNFVTVACGATVGVENIYNILYDTNAVSGFSATVDAFKSSAETPAAQGQFDAVCTGVFGRTVAQGLVITHFATYKRPTGIANQTLVLSQSVIVRAIHIEVVSQTLVMTQSAYAARSVLQTLVLSQTAACVRVRSASVHQTLAMTQSGTRTTVLARSVSQTLVFNAPRQVAAPIIGSSGGGDQTQFHYNQPLVNVALRTRNCLVVIGTPAQTVVLPCPLFGDSQHYTGTVDLKKTMTGDTFTYVRRTGTEVLKYSFNLGTYKAIELRDFLSAYSHELITLHNWKGETWYAFLTNNPFEFVHAARWQPRGERVDITLEFEGVRR